MDKDQIKNAVLNVFFGFCLGAGVLFFFASGDSDTLFASEDSAIVFVITLALIVCGILFSLIATVLKVLVFPCLARRRAALRALGKEGIRIVHRDAVAKLAYKGIYALMKGDFPKSEDCLQRALAQSDIRQNQCFCVEWLIHLYETIDNESKLIWCYRKAAELAPDNPEAQSRLGHAYFSSGNLDKAEYCFEQALRYDANNGYSYFSLAKIYMVRGEDDKAFEALQKLKKVNEQHPLCHATFADYYAMKGDREKAEEECKKAELCGIHDPDLLNKRISAMLSFHDTEFSGEDLPGLYYRRIEKRDETEKDAEDTQ